MFGRERMREKRQSSVCEKNVRVLCAKNSYQLGKICGVIREVCFAEKISAKGAISGVTVRRGSE